MKLLIGPALLAMKTGIYFVQFYIASALIYPQFGTVGLACFAVAALFGDIMMVLVDRASKMVTQPPTP